MTVISDAIALSPSAGWVPVLHHLVDSGDLARMHPSAAALYLAIKRHADFHSGRSQVSNRRLMQETGIAKPTFYAARNSLRDFGYIAFSPGLYPTVYTILEKLEYLSPDRSPVACSTFPFIPNNLLGLLKELRTRPLTRDQLGATVTIGSINVQVNVVTGPLVDKGANNDHDE